MSGAGIPSIPKISTLYPSRPGSAFSIRGRLENDERGDETCDRIYVLVWLEFVYLLYMYSQASCGVQTTGAKVALEMLRLLVLH